MGTTTRLDDVHAKVARAKAQLEAGLQQLQSSEDWRKTLEAMAVLGPTRVGRFSFRNIILLLTQGLSGQHAATFNTWRQLGRQVRRGEKGFVVLRPRIVKAKEFDGGEERKLVGFSYLTVFALPQTDGPELELVRPRDFVCPENFPHTVQTLREVALTLPHVSGIEVRERREGDSRAYGWFHRPTKSIVVLTDTTPAQQLATLVHELAHAILHGDEGHHDAAVREVEAESTAFVVCHALGLDSSSFTLPYIATWATGDDATKAVAAAGENIRRAATRILEALVPAEAAESEALLG